MKIKDYLTESATKWTDALPTKKGWYWVKNVGENEKFVRYFDGRYVETVLGKAKIEDFVKKDGFVDKSRLWAGPIPEPR